MTNDKERREQGARLASAREAAGYRSKNQAATENGWAPATYSAHERGTRTIGKDDADRYAKRFRQLGAPTSSEHILYGTGSIDPVSGDAGNVVPIRPGGYRVEPNAVPEAVDVMLPVRALMPRDIEELGATVGGFGDDETAFAMNGQVIDLVPRPPGLTHRKDVFALRVSNNSMWPKFKDGERVYVEKRKPAIGDDVVIELHPTEDGQPGKSFIKNLVSRNSELIVVEQYQPFGRLEFSTREVRQVLRVIPWQEVAGLV